MDELIAFGILLLLQLGAMTLASFVSRKIAGERRATDLYSRT
jgi:hypothetical protein